MKKTYIIPSVISVEVNTRSHLMVVSTDAQTNSLNSMSFDRETAGGSQLTKENKSVWDEEW